MKKVLLLFLVLALLVTSLSGCVQLQAEEERVLVNGLKGAVPEISQFTYLTSEEKNYVTKEMKAALVYVGMDESLIPGVAESYEFSADGTVLTLKLRKNVKWDDGTRITADDVVYTFNTLKNPDVVVNAPHLSTPLENIKSVTAVDARTTVIELHALDNTFMYWLGRDFQLAPEHVFGHIATEDLLTSEETLTNYVGAGPFRLVDFKSDQHVILERNPYWYGQRPDFDKYIFRVFTNQEAAVAALVAGEIDITLVSGEDIAYAQEIEGLDVTFFQKRGLQNLVFNNQNPKLQDVRVRKAMAHALDIPTLINIAYGGYGEPWANAFASRWALDSSIQTYEYSPEISRQLLSEAGYESGELELTLITYYTSPEVEAMQAMLLDAGIDVSIEVMTGPVWTETVDVVGEYDISYCGGFAGPDPDAIRSYYLANPTKRTYWTHERAAELIELAANTTDVELRTQYYHEYDNIVHEELPFISFMRVSLAVGYNSDRISNFTYHRYYWADTDKWLVK